MKKFYFAFLFASMVATCAVAQQRSSTTPPNGSYQSVPQDAVVADATSGLIFQSTSEGQISFRPEIKFDSIEGLVKVDAGSKPIVVNPNHPRPCGGGGFNFIEFETQGSPGGNVAPGEQVASAPSQNNDNINKAGKQPIRPPKEGKPCGDPWNWDWGMSELMGWTLPPQFDPNIIPTLYSSHPTTQNLSIADVTELIDQLLAAGNNGSAELNNTIPDVNKDGKLSIDDVTALIDILLKNAK